MPFSAASLETQCSLCGLKVRRDNMSRHRRLYCAGFPSKMASPPSADASVANESVVGSLSEGTDVFQVAVSADSYYISLSLQINRASTNAILRL